MNAQTLGWTLIHSLWQGLLIYLILKVSTRFVRNADVRYGSGVVGMVLLVTGSAITFFVLNQKSSGSDFQFVLTASQISNVQESSILGWVNENIIWFIRFWVLGFVVGLLRIASGLWYINRLRTNSHPVQDEWMDMVNRLSASLNINRVVAMAEAGISSPMVVGFVKPIILFPAGLLSGLTADQIETILVHELAHIRRQDYIINLVQSVIETIFFFNPFALLMSRMIREERENCCDDMVIAKGVSPITYARTLAQLEASRSSLSLAIGFAGNQNQLLNRIKRIMENSAKNDWGKGRLVPVALLFLGLVCASWLSISSEKEIEANHSVVAADTSREKGLILIKKGSTPNSWAVIAPDEPEPIEGEANRFIIEGIVPEMEIPPLPDDIFFAIPSFDSVPGFYFQSHDPEQWAAFEKEFTEKFKAQFGDFYNQNQKDFDKMMSEFDYLETARREAAEVIDFSQMYQESAIDQQQLAMFKADQAMLMARMAEDQAHFAEDMAQKAEAYKEELVKLLFEDGYLKSKDVEEISIDDSNGKLKINGQEIKDVHAVKYRALHDRFFGDPKQDVYRRHE